MSVELAVTSLVEDLAKRAAEGMPLHEYQVLCALRTEPFQKALSNRIGKGERITEIVRVYYSKNAGVVEILARIADDRVVRTKPRRDGVLATIHARTFECLSVIEDFEEPEDLKPEGVTFLPLVMALPSSVEACGVHTQDATLALIDSRRNAFAEEIVRETGGRVGGIEMKGTNCQSCNISNVQTSYSSTIPSTNNGHDNDSKTDTTTDPGSQECSTDTNDDSSPR